MIEGTETPKLPSKFAKCAARYKEFGSKCAFLGHCPLHTGQTPPLTPQTKLYVCIQTFFKVSTIYRVGGERNARKFGIRMH